MIIILSIILVLLIILVIIVNRNNNDHLTESFTNLNDQMNINKMQLITTGFSFHNDFLAYNINNQDGYIVVNDAMGYMDNMYNKNICISNNIYIVKKIYIDTYVIDASRTNRGYYALTPGYRIIPNYIGCYNYSSVNVLYYEIVLDVSCNYSLPKPLFNSSLSNTGPWLFTSCFASGILGPQTQNQINTAYQGSSLENKVTLQDAVGLYLFDHFGPTSQSVRTFAGGSQKFTLTGITYPKTFLIITAGASGGNSINQYSELNNGGRGIVIQSTLTINNPTDLYIVIGQKGVTITNTLGNGGGGGGASIVCIKNASFIKSVFIAGGGGGAGYNSNGKNGSIIPESNESNIQGTGAGNGGNFYYISGRRVDGDGLINPASYNFQYSYPYGTKYTAIHPDGGFGGGGSGSGIGNYQDSTYVIPSNGIDAAGGGGGGYVGGKAGTSFPFNNIIPATGGSSFVNYNYSNDDQNNSVTQYFGTINGLPGDGFNNPDSDGFVLILDQNQCWLPNSNGIDYSLNPNIDPNICNSQPKPVCPVNSGWIPSLSQKKYIWSGGTYDPLVCPASPGDCTDGRWIGNGTNQGYRFSSKNLNDNFISEICSPMPTCPTNASWKLNTQTQKYVWTDTNNNPVNTWDSNVCPPNPSDCWIPNGPGQGYSQNNAINDFSFCTPMPTCPANGVWTANLSQKKYIWSGGTYDANVCPASPGDCTDGRWIGNGLGNDYSFSSRNLNNNFKSEICPPKPTCPSNASWKLNAQNKYVWSDSNGNALNNWDSNICPPSPSSCWIPNGPGKGYSQNPAINTGLCLPDQPTCPAGQWVLNTQTQKYTWSGTYYDSNVCPPNPTDCWIGNGPGLGYSQNPAINNTNLCTPTPTCPANGNWIPNKSQQKYIWTGGTFDANVCPSTPYSGDCTKGKWIGNGPGQDYSFSIPYDSNICTLQKPTCPPGQWNLNTQTQKYVWSGGNNYDSNVCPRNPSDCWVANGPGQGYSMNPAITDTSICSAMPTCQGTESSWVPDPTTFKYKWTGGVYDVNICPASPGDCTQGTWIGNGPGQGYTFNNPNRQRYDRLICPTQPTCAPGGRWVFNYAQNKYNWIGSPYDPNACPASPSANASGSGSAANASGSGSWNQEAVLNAILKSGSGSKPTFTAMQLNVVRAIICYVVPSFAPCNNVVIAPEIKVLLDNLSASDKLILKTVICTVAPGITGCPPSNGPIRKPTSIMCAAMPELPGC